MKVLFVFAHPDDESFSCGGTIVKLTKKGQTVKLITATRGEAGSTGNPPLCAQEELGSVREKELRCAAEILGISDIFFLDYIDGTLKNVPIKILNKKILEIFTEEKPDIVITFNKEGGSRHPDHIQINKVTTQVFGVYAEKIKKHVRLYYSDIPKSLLVKLETLGTLYTFFGKIKGTADEDITTIVDISETIEQKIKAFQCHQTQKKDWEGFLKRKNPSEFTKEYFTLALEKNLW